MYDYSCVSLAVSTSAFITQGFDSFFKIPGNFNLDIQPVLLEDDATFECQVKEDLLDLPSIFLKKLGEKQSIFDLKNNGFF